MNRPEPKQPRGHVYNGTVYYELDGRPSKAAAKAAWQKDWIRWARQEFKRLRERSSA